MYAKNQFHWLRLKIYLNLAGSISKMENCVHMCGFWVTVKVQHIDKYSNYQHRSHHAIRLGFSASSS